MNLAQHIETYFGGTLSFAPEELDRYQKHFDVLKEWNEKINLVSRKSTDEQIALHYFDSIQIAELCGRNHSGLRLADIGSGAGFPGLILAIRFPRLTIRLFEKTEKKIKFLVDCCERLDLTNVEIDGYYDVHKRRNQVFLISRATYPPEELLKIAAKTMTRGCRVLLTRGGTNDYQWDTKKFLEKKSIQYELSKKSGERKATILEVI